MQNKIETLGGGGEVFFLNILFILNAMIPRKGLDLVIPISIVRRLSYLSLFKFLFRVGWSRGSTKLRRINGNEGRERNEE